MSFPIPSFAPFLCSSAKVVHQPLKVERSVLGNADGNGNERLTKM